MITVKYNWDAARIVNRVIFFDTWEAYNAWLRVRRDAIVILSVYQAGRNEGARTHAQFYTRILAGSLLIINACMYSYVWRQIVNIIKMSQAKYAQLLALFPAAWHEKLKLYTGEELYYAYRLCLFRPTRNDNGDFNSGDVTFLAIRSKLLRYLKGISYDEYGRAPQPIPPTAWTKLGRRWSKDFSEEYVYTEPVATQDALDTLMGAINAKRIA